DPSASSRLRMTVGSALLAQGLLEQSEDPLVFIGPRCRLDEAVVLHGKGSQLPVLFSQLDQPLCETDAVLEVHVRVDHAVADQQPTFQAFGEIDWRRLP